MARRLTAGCADGGAGVAPGAGNVVATVEGAEHAAKVNDANRRTESRAVEEQRLHNGAHRKGHAKNNRQREFAQIEQPRGFPSFTWRCENS